MVERLLLKVNTTLQQVKDRIVKACEEKRILNDEEIKEIEATVTAEQTLLNSLILTHNSNQAG